MSSPRNRHVAATLQGVGLGTLLFDMLKPDERDDPKRLTDIDLLRDRVLAATGLLGRLERTKNLPLGLFGASTGAGAAFCAAAQLQDSVVSLVSRGGRPDFAAHCLERVRAPTLLVVGGEDVETLELNRKAMSLLPGEVDLEVIPGATHLFAEAGALEAVSHLAADWFLSCFRHSSSIVLHAL